MRILILLAAFLFHSCSTSYNNIELPSEIVKSESDNWESADIESNEKLMEDSWWIVFEDHKLDSIILFQQLIIINCGNQSFVGFSLLFR